MPPDRTPDTGLPSEKAVEAAQIATVDRDGVFTALAMEHWEATIGRMASDPRNVETVRRVANAMHDPALGLNRSVRLGAVYDLLNDAYHPQNPTTDHPADVVERHFTEAALAQQGETP
jgi:hypothetical protein